MLCLDEAVQLLVAALQAGLELLEFCLETTRCLFRASQRTPNRAFTLEERAQQRLLSDRTFPMVHTEATRSDRQTEDATKSSALDT